MNHGFLAGTGRADGFPFRGAGPLRTAWRPGTARTIAAARGRRASAALAFAKNVHCGIVKKPLSIIALALGIIGSGLNMITIVMAGVVAGALCSLLHLRVFVVILLSPLFAMCAAAGGLIAHAYFWWIVVAVVGSIAALQVAYAAVTLLFYFVGLRKFIPQTQVAIGQKLRA